MDKGEMTYWHTTIQGLTFKTKTPENNILQNNNKTIQYWNPFCSKEWMLAFHLELPQQSVYLFIICPWKYCPPANQNDFCPGSPTSSIKFSHTLSLLIAAPHPQQFLILIIRKQLWSDQSMELNLFQKYITISKT